MNKAQIEWVDISAIHPYKRNPRKNEAAVDKVAESIAAFGFQQPIVCDMDGVIIVGHTRLKAAKKLGMETVPVIFADLPEDKAKAYRLADNKTNEFSEWDLDLLQMELDDIDLDMSLFGFDVLDEEPETVEDDYEPELPEEPKAKLGDVYQLGRHRLMCGDSTNVASVEILMGGVQADLFLTDPPYNVDYEELERSLLNVRPNKRVQNNVLTGIKNDKMDDDTFRSFLVNAFTAARENMKAGASFYIFHADSQGYAFRGACRDIGWTVRQCLIWEKQHISLGRQDYQWQHEPVLYGWNDGGSHAWYSDRKQTTILKFDKPQRSAEHPTMKPVPLFDYLIKNSSKAGDNVLDLFGGSGTTMIACEQNGRNAYLMELDPKYVDVIIDRWEKFTGEKAVLVSGEDRKTT